MASKVDYLAEEYSQLLVSQLDEQRAYFGGLLGKHKEEAESKAQESSKRCQSLETALQVTTADAKTAERKIRATENKMVRCHHDTQYSFTISNMLTCLSQQGSFSRSLQSV